MSRGLNDGLDCYLSEEASEALISLLLAGVERDLAFALIEKLMPEQDIYELPKDDGNGPAD
jgi:hypothetical protein